MMYWILCTILRFRKDQRASQYRGFLVIASSYDWDEAKTPRAKWLGGFKKNGEKYNTFDALNEHLSVFFTLHVKPLTMRLEVKESERKSVIKTLHVSVWKKR